MLPRRITAPGFSRLDLGEHLSIRSRSRRRCGPRYASVARRAGSAWPRITRRRVIPRWWVIGRRWVGRRWVIGWPVIAEGRRPREQPDRRGDDCCGDIEHGPHHAERPFQWKRRARRIVLRGIGLRGIGLRGIGLRGIGLRGIGLRGIGLRGIGLRGIGLRFGGRVNPYRRLIV